MKDLVRTITSNRKCGCPFKPHVKPVVGGKGWMVKLMSGSHNHELAKSLVGHPYAGRLIKDEKIIIVDMTKSMVKLRNILLTLKEHNGNSYTTIKQVYNARNAYRSSVRGSNTKMQQLMKLHEYDQYIHWCRNLPFNRRVRRTKKSVSSLEEDAWSLHQCLFEENIRKTKKGSANFKNKGSGVVYVRGR